jgi:hypothetical protein
VGRDLKCDLKQLNWYLLKEQFLKLIPPYNIQQFLLTF